jgi:hypothetical protein
MKLFLTIICFVSVACAANTPELIDSLFNDSTKYIFEVNKIDSAFLLNASQQENCNLKQMANPKDNFNKTDIIKQELPNRRLICFGQNVEYFFLAYEQGGRGYHSVFIVYKGDKFIKKITFYKKPKKINELRKIIKDRINAKK